MRLAVTLQAAHRAGWTLIETVVVVTLTTMLMSVAMALLHGIATWGDAADDSAHRAANFDRLERAIRDTARESTDVVADGDMLTFTMTSGKSAEFRLSAEDCVQTTPGGDTPHVERFAIGPRQPWQVTKVDNLVEVQIIPSEGERGLPFCVVAALAAQEGKP